jgi:hypothetical protein
LFTGRTLYARGPSVAFRTLCADRSLRTSHASVTLRSLRPHCAGVTLRSLRPSRSLRPHCASVTLRSLWSSRALRTSGTYRTGKALAKAAVASALTVTAVAIVRESGGNRRAAERESQAKAQEFTAIRM